MWVTTLFRFWILDFGFWILDWVDVTCAGDDRDSRRSTETTIKDRRTTVYVANAPVESYD